MAGWGGLRPERRLFRASPNGPPGFPGTLLAGNLLRSVVSRRWCASDPLLFPLATATSGQGGASSLMAGAAMEIADLLHNDCAELCRNKALAFTGSHSTVGISSS